MNFSGKARGLPTFVVVACLIAPILSGVAGAAPYIPGDDGQIVERLPYTAADPATRQLREQQALLQRQPNNLSLAVRVARRYIELGRVSADPRYAGYAQAALAPWWDLADPPAEVLVLRATLRQRLHDFDAALADLDRVLKTHPRAAQARLTKATVLQVQGFYDRAKAECAALQVLAQELIAAACLSNVASVSGQLRVSYSQLLAVAQRHPESDPDTRSWVLTMLAEMAARAGMAEAAEQHFRAALAADAADSYLLGAYADFLLDANRPAEVAALLKDQTRADGLLLRYALASKITGARQLAAQTEELRSRFEASRLRGDRVHLREEARFTLELLGDAATALKLAEENWRVQKEPADARILLAAASAANDQAAIATLRDWLAQTGLEDVQLSRLSATIGERENKTSHGDIRERVTALKPDAASPHGGASSFPAHPAEHPLRSPPRNKATVLTLTGADRRKAAAAARVSTWANEEP
jgi:hypothetical protein